MVFISYSYGPSTLAAFNLQVYLGTMNQTAPPYLQTNYSHQMLDYRGFCYVFSDRLNLGSGNVPPNFSFEVVGRLPFGGGIEDAVPAEIIKDFLTNPKDGAGFPSTGIDATTWADYRDYCIASSIFLSPVMTAQKPAADFIKEILASSNAEIFCSGDKLKFVPYSDMTASDNNVLWTPKLTPAYDLTMMTFRGNHLTNRRYTSFERAIKTVSTHRQSSF